MPPAPTPLAPVLPAGHPLHGVPAGADTGCPCTPCMRAEHNYVTHRTTAGDGIPRWRVMRRLRALRVIGYSPDQLAAMVPCDTATIHYLTEQARHVTTAPRDVAARILAIYDHLSGKPVTGPEGDLHRELALTLKWHSPLAWDDIDDRDEWPSKHARPDEDAEKVRKHDDVDPIVVARIMDGENVPATRAEREEVTRRWLAAGRTWDSLESFTGWHLEQYTKPKKKKEAAA